MKINVPHVAKLAHLPINKTGTAKLEKQLEATLEHIERLNEIDTSRVKGTNEVTNLVNVVREDNVLPSLPQEQALMNAKRTHNGFFVVPAIFTEAIEP